MPYQTINEFGNTSEGIQVLFLYVASIVPIFIPLLLFSFFIIMALGSYFAQIRLRGRGNFVASAAVASYITAIIAIFMTLQPGLIDTFTLSVTIIVAILTTFWLFVSKE